MGHSLRLSLGSSEHSEFCESIQELLFSRQPEQNFKKAKDRLLSENLKLSKGIKLAGTELGLKEHAAFQSLWWRAAL